VLHGSNVGGFRARLRARTRSLFDQRDGNAAQAELDWK
jgi:hypothetical protein